MFWGCTSLKNVTFGNNWWGFPNDTSGSAYRKIDLQDSPLTHDSCLDLFNKVADKTATEKSYNIALSDTTKGYMSEEEIAIATGKGWTVA